MINGHNNPKARRNLTTAQNVKQSESMELFALSFSVLFFALVIARWLSFDFRMFESYGIFALMAPLLGLAIGMVTEKDKSFRFAPYALLITTALIAVFNYLGINDEAFPAAGVRDLIQIGGMTIGHSTALPIMTWLVVMLLMGPFLFALCIGGRAGSLLTRQKALDGWWTVTLGLVLASLVFSATVFFNVSPGFQLVLVGISLASFSLTVLPIPALSALVIVLALAVPLFTELGQPGNKTIWTPLYRVEIDQSPLNHSLLRVELNHALEESLPASQGSNLLLGAQPTPHRNAELLFTAAQPKKVLLLGSGIGSLVAPAIKCGADSVEAVEAEPKLLEIGEEVGHHSNAKNLKLTAQDPRSFVNDAQGGYDLIVIQSPIGLGFSTALQDRFARTREAYKRCFNLLSPDGVLVVMQAQQAVKSSDWLYNRIFVTLKEAAGYDPLLLANTTSLVSQRFFLLGRPEAQKKLAEKLEKSGLTIVQMPTLLHEKPITDDQPFPFQRAGTAIFPYILLVGVMVALMMVSGPSDQSAEKASANSDVSPTTGTGLNFRHWQLFFCASGMMLLCEGALPPLFAIFGQNWLPNTLAVNFAILVFALSAYLGIRMVAVANVQQMLYQALFLLVFLDWCLPFQGLMSFNKILGIVVIVFITFMTILRASIALTAAYGDTAGGAKLFAFVLLGVVFGAMLESVSWFFGLKSLVALSEVFFIISFNCLLHGHKALMPNSQVAVKQIT